MNIKEYYDYMANAGKLGSIYGLLRIKELLKRLDNPQDKINVIHIAGTNGKGSVLAYLAFGYMKCGLKVARYTSPALYSYLERYMINDAEIDEALFLEYFEDVKSAVDSMRNEGLEAPTAFEIETAAAFYIFYKENVDVALIETGLGGRDDATNVIAKPIVTAFASISYDHMAILGHTLKDIASVKSGIMRDGVPVVISMMDDEAADTLIGEAKKHNSPVSVAEYDKIDDERVNVGYNEEKRSLHMPLKGSFQPMNLATAYYTMLAARYKLPCDIDTFANGIDDVKWPGRFEVISDKPLVIRDGAHNVDAVKRLRESVVELMGKMPKDARLKMVIGIFKDKDYEAMIEEIIDLTDEIYTVTPPNPTRCLNSADLYNAIVAIKDKKNIKGLKVIDVGDINKGLKEAIASCGANDVVVAFGSLSLSKELTI